MGLQDALVEVLAAIGVKGKRAKGMWMIRCKAGALHYVKLMCW